MSKITWRKLKQGDLFLIPCADTKKGFLGQILIPGKIFYMQVFDRLVDSSDSVVIPADGLGTPFLIGAATDDEFHRGHWKVVGTERVDSFPKPYHVVNTPVGLVLRDFYGADLGTATKADELLYGFEKTVSGVVFSSAVQLREEMGPEVDFGWIDFRTVSKRSARE